MEAIQLKGDVEEHPTPQIELVRAESTAQRLAWRTIDITIASLVLVLTAPLLLVAAISIRLGSSGPAIFRQRRVGLNGVPFTIHKLRTMRDGADFQPHREYVKLLITGQPSEQSAPKDDLFKLTVDERVTGIGRFLRRTSIDELPQLWDVVRGSMSLVGPRPVMAYELTDYPPEFYVRLAVKPGITGLWQVNGRNKLNYRQMIDLDIKYVESRSIWLNLTILLKTPWVVISSRGAA